MRIWQTLFAFAFFFCATTASAADLGCGRDTDRSGAVDRFCPTPDADFDGQASVLGGGTDCDDNNSACFNGIACKGSDTSHFKLCTNGVFGPDTANSLYTCKTNSGVDRWVDPNVTTCGHAGTYADPNSYRCHFDTGMSGYAAPSGDDCIILKYGTDGIYDQSWGSAPVKMFYTTLDGTSGHTIKIRSEPSRVITIEGQGSSPNAVRPVNFDTAQFWDITGNDAGGYSGLVIHGNYAEAGVYNHDSDDNIIRNLYVYRVDGNCGGGECGAVKLDSNSDRILVTNNQLEDTYAVADPTNLNSANIFVLRGYDNQFLYNTLNCASTSVCGKSGIFYKHCETTGNPNWIFRGNVVSKGDAQLSTSCGGATIDHNLFIDIAASDRFAISFDGGNGATYFNQGSLIELNTLVNSPAVQFFVVGSYEQSSTFGLVTFRKNVVVDNKATGYGSDGADGFWRICNYCSDAIFTAIITGAKVAFNSNDYYQTTGQALFGTIFGDNASTSSGTTQANFAAWQSAGLSTSERNENPSLDAYNIARSANTLDWGWFPANTITTETATSTGTAKGALAHCRRRRR